MVPLYAARIEDLGPGDFVRVECIACGHDALIPPSSLLHGLGCRLIPRARFGTAFPLPRVRRGTAYAAPAGRLRRRHGRQAADL